MIPEYKQELGNISKETNRFFQKTSWIHNSVPYSIDEILDELEEADINTTTSVDTLNAPIVNASQIRGNGINIQTHSRPFIPRKEYLQQRGNQGRRSEHTKDCKYEACGYTNRELHIMLKDLYTGDRKK